LFGPARVKPFTIIQYESEYVTDRVMDQCEALRILRARALHNTERSLREGGQCLLCGYGALIEECASPHHVFCDEDCQASLWGLDHFFTLGFKRGGKALVEMASHTTIQDAVLIRFFEWAYRRSLHTVEEYEELLAMRLVSDQFRRVIDGTVLPGIHHLGESIRRSLSSDAMRQFTGLLPLILILAEQHLTANAVRVEKLLYRAAMQEALYFLNEAIMTGMIGQSTHHLELDNDRVKLLYILYNACYYLGRGKSRPDEFGLVTTASAYSANVLAVAFHEAYLRLDLSFYKETPEELERIEVIVREAGNLSKALTRLLPGVQGEAVPEDSEAAAVVHRINTFMWDSREDLLRMVTLVLTQDLAHLREKESVWRMLASDVTLSDLLEPSEWRHAELNKLFGRVRNYAMARNIYLTHTAHPHSLVVVKCGLLHTMRRDDSMIYYLEQIYRMVSPVQLETIVIDSSLDYNALVSRLGLEEMLT
jgi:hypothetical protein